MTKMLLIPQNDKSLLTNFAGVIIGLKNYAVDYNFCLDIEEIENYVEANKEKEIFIAINKNLHNKDLEELESILIKLDHINIQGVLFYDIAVLYLKQKLKLHLNLVWNQSHMVTNYNTCNYYYKKGCDYAYLSSEITCEEILEIVNNSQIKSIIFAFGHSRIAFSKRKLLTNYFSYINKLKKDDTYLISDKIENNEYIVKETTDGTSVWSAKILNGIRPLYELKNKVDYIVMEQIDNDNFYKMASLFQDVLKGNYPLEEALAKAKLLYPNTTEGFFYKKTIYKVKNDEEKN